MSWRERDYHQETRSGGGWAERLPPMATLSLLTAHVAGFLVVLMVNAGVGAREARWFPLDGAAPPIAIALHPFATRSPLALAALLLAVYWLGWRLESRLGGRRLVWLYVGGALIAGAAYFGLTRLWPGVAHMPLLTPVGGLACWSVVAWRRLADDAVFVFGQVFSASKFVACCALLAVVWTLLSAGGSPVAWLAAVIVGALTGAALELLGTGAQRPVGRVRLRARRRFAEPKPAEEPDIDDLLSKISREGLASLTPQERQRLEDARQARLRRQP